MGGTSKRLEVGPEEKLGYSSLLSLSALTGGGLWPPTAPANPERALPLKSGWFQSLLGDPGS